MNTGGPAFPHIDSGCGRFEAGMTLRDYFAAKAMQGWISANPDMYLAFIEQSKKSGSISELSYFMADAMLKAREQ